MEKEQPIKEIKKINKGIRKRTNKSIRNWKKNNP